jgi:hypothetical protein
VNKVFGIGLTNTGTQSLTEALNILGIKTIHYPRDKETFKCLLRGMLELPILEQFDGMTDTPVIPFYKQFDRIYPNSKFILTVRDLERWLERTKRHMGGIENGKPSLEGYKSSIRHWGRIAVYGTVCWDREIFRTTFTDHFADCKMYFEGRDDLLIMDICAGDGWETLCPFLGKEIPDVPFPHLGAGSVKEIL